jgi:two-component system chemotaxis response regulator CheY
MRALVIDDHENIRSILARHLVELNFEVVEAADGREALDCLATSGEFDLALVDWNMPNMNGLEFVRAVRADPAFDGLLLIMVTSKSGADIAAALEAGANEYVVKPFTQRVINEKLTLLGLLGD